MSLGAQMKIIEVALRANVSHYTANIGLAVAQTRVLGREMTDFSGTTEKGLQSISTGAAVMGAGMLAGFGIAAGAAMRFDAEMSNVQGATGATASQMGMLRQAALDAGQATVFSATEAATAQAELGKAGVSTANILGGALTGSLDLAAAGGIDLARSAEITAFALNTFSLAGADAGHVSDVLAAGANKSAADVNGMAMSLQQTGLVASQFGIGLEDTVGTLSMFAQAGLQGSDAGTSMKTMLTAFVPKSAEAAAMMKDLGLEFFDANGEFVGLTDAAEQLQTRLGGLTDEQRINTLQTLFGGDAIRAASILYRQGGEGVSMWAGEVNDAGYAAELARIKTDNLRGDLEELGGAMETALIQTGAKADGALRSLTQSAAAAVQGFSSMPGPLDQVTIGLAGVGGAILTGAGAVGLVKPKYDELIGSLQGAGRGGEFAAKGIGMASFALAAAAPGLIYAAVLWGNIEKAGIAAAAAATQGLAAPKTLADYQQSINDTVSYYDSLNTKIAEGTEQTSFFGDALVTVGGPLGVLANLSGNEVDFSQMLDPFDENTVSNMEATTRELAKMLDTAIPGYENWAQASARLQTETGMTADEIDRFAQKAGIDLRGSLAAMQEEFGLTDEQVSQLASHLPDAGTEVDQLVTSFLAARDAAALADPEMSALAAGFGTVADGAATAEEKIGAYSDTIDTLLGVHISSYDAETKFAQALFDVSAALLWNGQSFDVTTEAGRKNREVVSGAAQAAIDHATAVAEETGSIQAGNEVLAWHAVQLLGVMTQMGLTEEQAKTYIGQLGLTPENLATLVAMNGTDTAKTKLDEVNTRLDDAGQGAHGTVTVDTTQADAALEALRQKAIDIVMNYIGRPNPAPTQGRPGPPQRAAGGPVGAGMAYTVNERGPELLEVGGSTMLMMSGRDGRVIPNHDPRTQRTLAGAGGGQVVQQIVHNHAAPTMNFSAPNYVGDERQLFRDFAQKMREEIRQMERSTTGRD